MQSTDKADADTAIARSERADMARYGIVWVPVDTFHLGDYRYTNLKDAIAHAKQVAKARSSDRAT